MINGVSSALNCASNKTTGQKPEDNNSQFSEILKAELEVISVSPLTEESDTKSIDNGENVSHLISLDEINKDIKRDYLEFQELVDGALDKEGIKKDPAFEIFADSDGMLYINSEREDKEKIEKVLNETQEIKDIFQRMSENSATAAGLEKFQNDVMSLNIVTPGPIQQYDSMHNVDPEESFSIKVSEESYTPAIECYGRIQELYAFIQIANGDFYDLMDLPLELETTTVEE